MFSGLHITSASKNWKVYFQKLSSRFSKCRVLVVLLTKALYNSLNCLKEIYTGLSEKKVIEIIPVVFEDGSSFPSKAGSYIDSSPTLTLTLTLYGRTSSGSVLNQRMKTRFSSSPRYRTNSARRTGSLREASLSLSLILALPLCQRGVKEFISCST